VADQSLIKLLVILVTGLFFPVSSLNSSSNPAVVRLDSRLTVILLQREIYIEIVAKPEKERRAAMDIYVESSHRNNNRYLIKKGFRSSSPVYRIPWDLLTCDGKILAIHALFPDDSLDNDGWTHTITYCGSHGETLWRISSWFTGSGTHADELAKINSINPRKLGVGHTIKIPRTLLIPCFGTTIDYPVTVDDLIFQKDREGVYAEYILLAGQTIYSLVLKYTPRLTADDVMAASRLILKRSNLKDFHSIPANTTLKIPSDLISPQFLPPTDPRRIQFENTARESGLFKAHHVARALQGVTVILDAGHGGVDPGAVGIGGVKEKEYAYDVMCRVKRILETETKAAVHVTIKDDETGFEPRNGKLLRSGNNRERILTTPVYPITNSAVALNLRWMLVNYVFYTRHDAKTRNEQVIFTSFHADSLHPSAQGLMVYVPGADYYSGNIKKTEKVYLSRKEAKAGRNSVSHTRRDRLRAEGFSLDFADHVRKQCIKANIPMHSNQPVRKFVMRNRRSWVPAILRYSTVPTRVLIELVNLQNTTDVKRIMDPDYRESLARMYVNALKEHFSESSK
jgi:N-acetylmuramoyl-L-alanine amidase